MADVACCQFAKICYSQLNMVYVFNRLEFNLNLD